MFYHAGQHIRDSIERKIKEQLEPRYVAFMKQLRTKLADPEDVKEGDEFKHAAALVSMMFHTERGTDAEWLRYVAEQAAKTLETIDNLRAIQRSAIVNAMYIIDQHQAKEYGV